MNFYFESYQNLNDIKSAFFALKIFKLVFVWIIIEMLLLLLIIEKIDSDQSRNNHQIEIYKIFRALMMQKNVAMKRDDANISMIFAAVRTNTLRLKP